MLRGDSGRLNFLVNVFNRRLHRFFLDHNTTVETSGGEKPHITVTIDYDNLTGAKQQLPELDGYSVEPETIRRWACVPRHAVLAAG